MTRQDRKDLPVLWHTDHSLDAIAWEERRRIRKAVARSREHRQTAALLRLLGPQDDEGEER